MSTEDQQTRASEAPTLTSRGSARRRLTKAGLGAASVLWSLDSRATMNTMVCVSPSGALSGGLNSNYAKSPPKCVGKSPGFWKNHTGAWPCSIGKDFDDVFGCSAKYAKTYATKTLYEIVRGCDFDKYNFGMQLVATYLNVLSGRIGFLSVPTLQQMWNQIQNQGYYQPAKGVFWSAEQTKRYLEATHD
ncbi:hypothetical protein [Massilia sp. IC2-476]|uniref:hypothetical protein n=1 Tax=Massilia sp. IC2-476 TaxID=2887199 RepID=UPI001D11EE61|nr:hypothetical protein [Massilia sp. IC2-476]MCC2973062.1 hypothetical protein [Massilia sp. IC2-476]